MFEAYNWNCCDVSLRKNMFMVIYTNIIMILLNKSLLTCMWIYHFLIRILKFWLIEHSRIILNCIKLIFFCTFSMKLKAQNVSYFAMTYSDIERKTLQWKFSLGKNFPKALGNKQKSSQKLSNFVPGRILFLFLRSERSWIRKPVLSLSN